MNNGFVWWWCFFGGVGAGWQANIIVPLGYLLLLSIYAV